LFDVGQGRGGGGEVRFAGLIQVGVGLGCFRLGAWDVGGRNGRGIGVDVVAPFRFL